MTASDTSVQAFESRVRPTLVTRHMAVLSAMADREDWSNTELSRRLGWPINAVTPRIHELRMMKPAKVEFSQKRQCMVTGLTVKAWRITR